MRLVVPVIAGIWLFATGVQGLAFLVKYGMMPLPPVLGRLDFTPQYTLLAALVIVGAAVARMQPAELAADPQPKPPGKPRDPERKRGKRE